MAGNPFLDVLLADTQRALNAPLGGGEDVTVQPGGDAAAAVSLRAFFEVPYVEPAPGATAPMQAVAPTLHIPAVHVTQALGRLLTYRDHVVVRGTRYRVQNAREDGYGLLACKLLESAEAAHDADDD
ncbi:hypothetical protein [uncultured Desulfovibrio sp.]|uniref:head-tail joining protein n=1 Tax=uncultured Desulfovibrio sp. TaxID=167968 RepID=UPI0026094D4F|nr:hypothetical protein [uncultured Desulfovibrio sp.]